MSTPDPPTPGVEEPRSAVGAVAGAWAMAVTGLLWSSLLSFSASMLTAPRMSLGGALLTVPMPLLAAWIAAHVVGRARRGEAPRWTTWAVLPVFAVAALALFVGWALYLRLG